jgi:hypothetical protein
MQPDLELQRAIISYNLRYRDEWQFEELARFCHEVLPVDSSLLFRFIFSLCSTLSKASNFWPRRSLESLR